MVTIGVYGFDGESFLRAGGRALVQGTEPRLACLGPSGFDP